MTRSVRTCAADDSLRCPAQIMWDQDCGCVPIVDGESRVIGIVTDRDICMAAWTQDRRLSEIPVSSAMSWQVRVCQPSDSLEFAERMMRDNQIRRLPVVDAHGRILGLISLADIAHHANAGSSASEVDAEEVSATLAGVCRPRRAAVPAHS